MACDKAGKHGGKAKAKRSARAGLLFPVSKALRDLKKLNTRHVTVETEAAVYTSAVLEFLAAEEALDKIANLSTGLEGHIEQDTKRAIKEICKKIKRQMKVINSTQAKALLEQMRIETIEIPTDDKEPKKSLLQEKAYKPDCQLCKSKKVETAEMQTQIDEVPT
ncbi:unnamed protein product [Ceutorhynchus assimilis]|uniref:Histone H2A n=1 Tax=Ceutorhynchus assimilis TaxID=467358 RepID=A0A9N9QNI9_9CUCU|nr:unnamed protein product [Ceutorhynchus assimilis]